MTTFRALLFVCAGLLSAVHAHATAPTSFVIGVLPVHSARVLAERYEPLRAYLEKSLEQPVRIESAADFRRFHERTARGDFDLAITAAHLARVAQKDAGLPPLAQFSPDHDLILFSAAERPLANIQELKGKQLAVIDRLAITVMAAIHHLSTQGLEVGLDYQAVEHKTPTSVAHSVTSGLSLLGVSARQSLLQLPDDLRRKVVVHGTLADIPAFVLLAKPGVDKALAERLKNLLLAFQNEAAGVDFLGRVGYGKLIPANEAALKRVDAYLKETRKALK